MPFDPTDLSMVNFWDFLPATDGLKIMLLEGSSYGTPGSVITLSTSSAKVEIMAKRARHIS
jgi:hypothetical protein